MNYHLGNPCGALIHGCWPAEHTFILIDPRNRRLDATETEMGDHRPPDSQYGC